MPSGDKESLLSLHNQGQHIPCKREAKSESHCKHNFPNKGMFFFLKINVFLEKFQSDKFKCE